jgi:hypothetical protein
MSRELGRVKTVEEIDVQIAELEEEISQSSDAKTEKQLITKIQKLKKSKDTIKEFAKVNVALDDEYKKLRVLQDRVKQLSTEIKNLAEERQTHYSKLNTSSAERQKHVEEKQELYKKQKVITEKIKATYDDIDAEYKKHREQIDKYWEYQKLFKTEEAKLKKKQYQERKAQEEAQRKKYLEEKAARDAERKAQDDAYKKEWEEYEEFCKQNPYETEIAMTEGLLKFFTNLKAQSDRKKQGKNKTSLTVPFDKVQALEQLKIEAPTQPSQIAATITSIEEKLKHFKSFIGKAPAAPAKPAAAAEEGEQKTPADATSPKEAATEEQQQQA